MRLELGNIFIKDVQFGDATKVEGGVLYINKDEMLKEIGGDEHIKSLDIDITRPGDEVRITPV
ncbi:MAG: beta-aspartyl-peptidase, partial [Clostridiales bacterium]|nr:beta-aspartyl-peptidase [Clostridiales bacterium]